MHDLTKETEMTFGFVLLAIVVLSLMWAYLPMAPQVKVVIVWVTVALAVILLIGVLVMVFDGSGFFSKELRWPR